MESGQPGVAFVEAGAASGGAPGTASRVVALSTSGLEELPALIAKSQSATPVVARLICPVGVFDFTGDGLRVREVRHGLTAADLQRQLGAALWAGPDLKELGSH